jgi:ribonuclease BN (tRNA processing enzyme)
MGGLACQQVLGEHPLFGGACEREDAGRTGHSAAGPVADLARAAGVRRLGLVHHHPLRDDAGIEAIRQAMEARAGCPVLRLEEGVAIEIG